MEGWLFYLGTSAVSVLAFVCGFRLAKKGKRTAGIIAGVITLVLAFKAVLHYRIDWEAWLFPWTWYVYLQSYWLFPVGLAILGVGVAQAKIHWNRYVLIASAAGLLCYSLWAGRWMVTDGPLPSEARANSEHLCRQTTGYSCGPASCVSLLSILGVDSTEGEMARLCLTHSAGTTPFNVYRGLKLKLKGKPFDVQIVRLSAKELHSLGVPAVVGLRSGHAFTIWPVPNSKVTLLNPLWTRPWTKTLDRFEADYDGIAVVVFPKQ